MKIWLKNLYKKKFVSQKPHICLPGVRFWLNDLLVHMFPQMGQLHFSDYAAYESSFLSNKEKFIDILNCHTDGSAENENLAERFYETLEKIEHELAQDIDFIYQSDPACRSTNEVIAAYPGFYAIACHRIASEVYRLGIFLIARMLSEIAHEKTGIDIHPGAQIGNPLFIDHGTGIVIGETAVVGSRVKIYQGVTLGALSVSRKMSGKKRHPTVENDCVIYSNATILGGDTVIGEGSTIGGNVWLAQSVKPHVFVKYTEQSMLNKI